MRAWALMLALACHPSTDGVDRVDGDADTDADSDTDADTDADTDTGSSEHTAITIVDDLLFDDQTGLLQADIEWSPSQRREFALTIDEEADRLDRLIANLRTRTGSNVVARKRVMYTLKRILAEHGAIGLLCDGGGKHSAVIAPFLGTVLISSEGDANAGIDPFVRRFLPGGLEVVPLEAE